MKNNKEEKDSGKGNADGSHASCLEQRTSKLPEKSNLSETDMFKDNPTEDVKLGKYTVTVIKPKKNNLSVKDLEDSIKEKDNNYKAVIEEFIQWEVKERLLDSYERLLEREEESSTEWINRARQLENKIKEQEKEWIEKIRNLPTMKKGKLDNSRWYRDLNKELMKW